MVSIGLYALLIWRIPTTSYSLNPAFYFVVSGVAASTVIVMLAIRRALLARAETVLSSKASDAAALARWRAAHILAYALSESVALYGVVLHFVGATASQVAPFLIAALLLMMFLRPVLPGPAMGSEPIEPV